MRYLLFGTEDCYYAFGGSHDLITSGDNLSELLEKVSKEKHLEWWHVYNLEKQKIVAGSTRQAYGIDELKTSSHNVDDNCQFFEMVEEGVVFSEKDCSKGTNEN